MRLSRYERIRWGGRRQRHHSRGRRTDGRTDGRTGRTKSSQLAMHRENSTINRIRWRRANLSREGTKRNERRFRLQLLHVFASVVVVRCCSFSVSFVSASRCSMFVCLCRVGASFVCVSLADSLLSPTGRRRDGPVQSTQRLPQRGASEGSEGSLPPEGTTPRRTTDDERGTRTGRT
jgi:hypothetical protein